MPMSSIANGCTGTVRQVGCADFVTWKALVRAGDKYHTPREAAEQTILKHLHCLELWMPGGCNLQCRHCYVATRKTLPVMTESEYYELTQLGINSGFTDIVVPGMEPLLRNELWAVLDAAGRNHARSVGVTTNATLLTSAASRLNDSSLTVLNVSLDGPREVHDRIRGMGVYDRLDDGVHRFREISEKRILTNTTVNRENADVLVKIAQWCSEKAIDYAAFHPFELADEAENSLILSRQLALKAYLDLLEAFRHGNTSSIALEAEASTCWLIVDLARSGAFDNSQLVIDEAGLIFLREICGDHELLVGLNFYPHHFIRTIRITESGGLSSCRGMARSGWQGFGDVRKDGIIHTAQSNSAIEALARIWQEYQDAFRMCDPDALDWIIAFVESHVDKHPMGINNQIHKVDGIALH